MIDLNVVLDVVQRRGPFYSGSAGILTRVILGADVVSSAEAADCEWIITRNVTDFALSPIPAVTPEEFLARLNPTAS